MKTLPIKITEDKITDFCHRWQIVEFALFGSVLRSDFRPDSDIDVLVTFSADSQLNWQDLEAMKEELEELFGRKVDLINKRHIEESDNWLRRQNILRTARVFYAAGSKFTTDFVENKLSLPQIKFMRDRATLLDLLTFTRNILAIAEGMDREELESDIVKQSAILYQITILGEAVKRLSPEFRSQHPDIPWKKIAGMRDIVTHDYNKVNLKTVWDVIQNNIPEQIVAIEPLIPTQEE